MSNKTRALLLVWLWLAPASRPSWAEEPAASASAAPVASEVAALDAARDRLVRRVADAGGKVGIAVLRIGQEAPLTSHLAGEPLWPASNMKLYTAWAALRALGPDHRYLTGLYGDIAGDRVDALTLRGEGDPSLESRHLYEMVARLARAGVKRVGDIVVDQRAFDEVFVPPAFDAQPGEWAAFRAPVAAVSLAANTVLVEVRAREPGQPAQVHFWPPSFVRSTGSVATSAADRPEAVQLSLSPADGPHGGRALAATLGGSIPAGSPALTVWRRVDDPTLLAGYGLRDALRELGIAVEGRIRPADARHRRGALLSSHSSEPLSKLLYALGKFSNNFYAEMIFKSLSAGDAPASFARSSAALEALLDAAGIDRHGMRFSNGSGLFDAGRLTALGTARLLAAAARDPTVAPEMLAHLSIGGVDGTLRGRFESQRSARSIRAKTGTLADVSALSGYVLGAGGQPSYAFSILVNDVRGRAASMRGPIDAFVSAIAALARQP